MYDVMIIGAGVVGCAIARELSRYQVNACNLEKCEDVCEGTSKANSAIAHAGYDAKEGGIMARLNVQGSQMLPELSKELDFPYRQNGSLVVSLNEDTRPQLEELLQRGTRNGVKGLRIIEQEELHEMEPNLSENAVLALYAPSAGIVCPFGMTIAFAENAFVNGVDFRFNTEVRKIVQIKGGYRLLTSQGDFETKTVVNAAGVYADVFHNMVSNKKIHILPRRGDYCLLEKEAGGLVSRTVFPLPASFGKGVLVAPTVHGNLIVGPTAMDVEDKEATNVRQEGLDFLAEKASMYVKGLPLNKVITSFAGLRAHEDGHEFIIGEVEDSPGFFDVAGIESPGLTSSPAIGVMVADILRDKLGLRSNPDFIGTRKGIFQPSGLSMDERTALILKQPAYGKIVCRCESISEGEILDAIHRPLGAKSLDGIKRRTRAGMGRCQAGFCTPKTMHILARELQVDIFEITKTGGASKMIVGRSKDRWK